MKAIIFEIQIWDSKQSSGADLKKYYSDKCHYVEVSNFIKKIPFTNLHKK